MRISYWSSDVCSSDLRVQALVGHDDQHHFRRLAADLQAEARRAHGVEGGIAPLSAAAPGEQHAAAAFRAEEEGALQHRGKDHDGLGAPHQVAHVAADLIAVAQLLVGQEGARNDLLMVLGGAGGSGKRSEEHTSELQSLMRISYAVFCLKKKKINELLQYRLLS